MRAGGFEAVILDVDGTLVDSNDAHARAFAEVLNVPFERVRPLIGMGSDKLMPRLIGRYDESLAERKKEIFRQRYLPSLRPLPKARELLRELRSKGVRLVAASSAGKDELDALLRVTGAQEYLEGHALRCPGRGARRRGVHRPAVRRVAAAGPAARPRGAAGSGRPGRRGITL